MNLVKPALGLTALASLAVIARSKLRSDRIFAAGGIQLFLLDSFLRPVVARGAHHAITGRYVATGTTPKRAGLRATTSTTSSQKVGATSKNCCRRRSCSGSRLSAASRT